VGDQVGRVQRSRIDEARGVTRGASEDGMVPVQQQSCRWPFDPAVMVVNEGRPTRFDSGQMQFASEQRRHLATRDFRRDVSRSSKSGNRSDGTAQREEQSVHLGRAW